MNAVRQTAKHSETSGDFNMKTRELTNGKRVKDAPESVKMTIDSKCPKKWAFVDMETGEIWVHKSRHRKYKKSPYTFFAADVEAVDCIQNILDNQLYI